ncbi:MAG: hypothetical protein K5Q00_03390 [Gammaproteobacteria bacterium]|nr:hypothetical protein [Gammaproteobacteria bacterium]
MWIASIDAVLLLLSLFYSIIVLFSEEKRNIAIKKSALLLFMIVLLVTLYWLVMWTFLLSYTPAALLQNPHNFARDLFERITSLPIQFILRLHAGVVNALFTEVALIASVVSSYILACRTETRWARYIILTITGAFVVLWLLLNGGLLFSHSHVLSLFK